MASGRSPDLHALQIEMARLKGESEGRMMGRIDERTAITNWLKYQSGSPKDLAGRITMGEHTRNTNHG